MDLRELRTEPIRRHPWEVARADFFVELVRENVAGRPVSVLDVGAGDGYLARRLAEALPAGSLVTCFDAHYTDDHIATLSALSPRGVTYTRERATGPVDWLLLLDVVEHVADDASFLRDFVEHDLAPGGALVISVPAWPALYSKHDEVLGHYRRYRPRELSALVARAGLERVAGGFLFSSLVLPRAAKKALEALSGDRAAPPTEDTAGPAATDVSDWRGGRLLTVSLEVVLRADAKIGRACAELGLQIPGLSLWARARRR